MDRQCSSCGGFCKKSGCERENVKPKEWQGLTNEEIEDAYLSGTGFVLARQNNVQQHLSRYDNFCFARAIEKTLRKKNNG
jgi:hypothetical protein